METYRPRMARSWPGPRPRSWSQKFRDVLRNNLHNPDFSISLAAEALCMSERSLQRKLHAQGTSFRQELLRVRTEAAQTMLRSGKRTADVARHVGYRRREHFSRAFRRCCGQTPSDWRHYDRRSRKP